MVRGRVVHPHEAQVAAGGVGFLEPVGSLSGEPGGTRASLPGEGVRFG